MQVYLSSKNYYRFLYNFTSRLQRSDCPKFSTKELLFVTLKWAKYHFLLLKSFLVFLGMTLWLRIGNDRAGHITLLRRRRRILYQLLIIHILCSTVIKYSVIQILISFSITHCSLASEINVLNANCLEI